MEAKGTDWDAQVPSDLGRKRGRQFNPANSGTQPRIPDQVTAAPGYRNLGKSA